MSVQYFNCSHCRRKHAVLHCDSCDMVIADDLPGIFIGNLQFNAAARDLNTKAADESGDERLRDVIGRSAANLCMPCAVTGVNLAQIILRRERQWPERTV